MRVIRVLNNVGNYRFCVVYTYTASNKLVTAEYGGRLSKQTG